MRANQISCDTCPFKQRILYLEVAKRVMIISNVDSKGTAEYQNRAKRLEEMEK